MASVCGLATARLLFCQLTVVLSAIYAAISALAPGDAIRIYDYDSLLNIKATNKRFPRRLRARSLPWNTCCCQKSLLKREHSRKEAAELVCRWRPEGLCREVATAHRSPLSGRVWKHAFAAVSASSGATGPSLSRLGFGTILVSCVYFGSGGSASDQLVRPDAMWPWGRWLRTIPKHKADKHAMTSPSSRIGLLNARSIANQSFALNELFIGKS